MKQASTNNDLSERLLNGIRVAQKRMLIEKALHGQTVIVGDGKGNPVELKASEILANNKLYFDNLRL